MSGNMHGGEAISRRLDEMAGGVSSSVDSERGLSARMKYLTGSTRGYKAMEQAGVNVKAKTLMAWLSGDQEPSKANRAKLDRAYRSLRRQNVAKAMKQRLNAGGGTRVEVHPVNQAGAVPARRRNLHHRRITIRNWDPIIDAWQRDDMVALQGEWESAVEDVGTDYRAYVAVSSLGFAA